MKFENLAQALEALEKHQRTAAAYGHALGVLFHDGATAAPKGSYPGRGRTMEIMSQITYEMETSAELGELIAWLEEHRQELTAVQQRQVEVLRKNYDQMHKIPQEEYVAYSVMVNESEAVWEKAKHENDFASFAPWLEKIVAANRKFAGYYNPDMKPYDALLNEYEEGLNMQTLDGFFATLRSVIVPLVEQISKKDPVDDSFLFLHYPVEQQRKFSDYLMEVMGLNREYCGIAESEHPYTTNFNNHDVRITTHYYEDALASSLYSVVHEGGHALYELGADDCYNDTVLSGGVSMGLHESQSRFYENIIGRSQAFIGLIFPKLQELFPEQLKGVTADMFYRAVNKAQPSLIRTESDELTYALHIMVRYELEKQLIDGTLAVADVPAAWNRLYKEYLGVDVPDDTQGCLQDSHWAGGMIGYFPSYALGSAYGPQMLHVMEKELSDVQALVAGGELHKVTAWLREHFHRHASFYKPDKLFEMTCGKFDAAYFTEYLRNKYTKLYDL